MLDLKKKVKRRNLPTCKREREPYNWCEINKLGGKEKAKALDRDMGPRVKAFPKTRGLGYNVVAKFCPTL